MLWHLDRATGKHASIPTYNGDACACDLECGGVVGLASYSSHPSLRVEVRKVTGHYAKTFVVFYPRIAGSWWHISRSVLGCHWAVSSETCGEQCVKYLSCMNTRRYLCFSAITLKDTPFFSMHHSEAVLFEGINRNSVDFDPIYQLAAQLFTHLCIACGSYHQCTDGQPS